MFRRKGRLYIQTRTLPLWWVMECTSAPHVIVEYVRTNRCRKQFNIFSLRSCSALVPGHRGYSAFTADLVMSQPFPTVPSPPNVILSEQAGFRLKQIRERLGLTLRQVEEASLELADAERSSEYIVSTARLNQIENDGSLPSIYKFYALAVIYRLGVEEMMGLYGINVSKMEEHRHATLQSATHLFTVEVGDPARPIRFPIRFDPGFRPEKTVFLSRLIEAWGEIPAGLLSQLDFKKFRYGFIGLEDRMMVPILRPG